jgi:hypothetical protein
MLTLNSATEHSSWSCVSPAGPDHPCSEVYLWALTEVHLFFLLHSNTWLCPHRSGCSFAATVNTWDFFRIWWIWLGRVCIVCTLTISFNSSNLLQPLLSNMVQPVHPVTTEGESEAAEESQGPTRLHKASPKLHQLHLKLDSCKYREVWSGTGTYIHWSSHSCPLTHSVSHVLHKSPLKVAQGKPSSVTTPWWVVCVQCWSLNGITWEPRDGLLSQSWRVSVCLVFMIRGKSYLYILLLHCKLYLEVTERLVSRVDVNILEHL